MEEVAKDFGGRAVVAKLNCRSAPTTASKYNIQVVPTLIVFKNGAVVARKEGSRGKQELVDMLNQAMGQ